MSTSGARAWFRWGSRVDRFLEQIRPRRKSKQQGFRRLVLDPLEDRMLLSVSPLTSDAILINQTFGQSISTTVGKAVATADNGDFVATWSKSDNLLDAAGNPITVNGSPLTQSDVWARYFTQEVQRITLPSEIAVNNDDDPNTVGRFSLTYNTQTIQEITFSAGTAPTYDPIITDIGPMQGNYTLWFDANNNGKVDSGEQATLPFNESSIP